MATASTPSTSGTLTGDQTDSELVARAAQTAHETVDRLADKAGPAVQKLETSVAQANEALHDQINRARELGDEWVDNLRGTVREHPLTSVMVALAAGAIISRLSR